MNYRFWTTLTATVLTTAFGSTLSSYADTPPTTAPSTSANLSPIPQEQAPIRTATNVSPESASTVSKTQRAMGVQARNRNLQSAILEDQEGITQIQLHEIGGYQAATLYIRSTPFLTFFSSRRVSLNGSRPGEAVYGQYISPEQTSSPGNTTRPASGGRVNAKNSSDDPVQRAKVVAARINQLYTDRMDARKIQLRWNAERASYSIRANGKEVVELNGKTRFVNMSQDLAEDSLQATNLLRQLMGNASPLERTVQKPRSRSQRNPNTNSSSIFPEPILLRLRGLASWYGPGFHGNQSASGEVFNQNAMTAAHRSLPFGTRARVTNLNNGRSVVVRINDRGPYVRGRILDLSAGAARALGMMNKGVAPVRIEVLDSRRTASAEQ